MPSGVTGNMIIQVMSGSQVVYSGTILDLSVVGGNQLRRVSLDQGSSGASSYAAVTGSTSTSATLGLGQPGRGLRVGGRDGQPQRQLLRRELQQLRQPDELDNNNDGYNDFDNNSITQQQLQQLQQLQ